MEYEIWNLEFHRIPLPVCYHSSWRIVYQVDMKSLLPLVDFSISIEFILDILEFLVIAIK